MATQQIRNGGQKSSVILHIANLLDERDRKHLESVVQQVEGVTHTRFNQSQQHLMIVGYNPNRTNSQKILGRVLRQHLRARLI